MRTVLALALALAACSSSPVPVVDAQASPDVVGVADAGTGDALLPGPDDGIQVDAPAVDAALQDVVDAPAADVPATPDVVDAEPGCIDRDRDTFGVGCAAGPDCDDNHAGRHPGARELCDGIDQNCDGLVDVLADAGVAAPYDPAVTPRCEELLPPVPGRPWGAGQTPVCVLPTMPPAFQRCRVPANAPTCIACRGTGSTRECVLRGELSSGGCIPF